MTNSQILIYQSPTGAIRIDVRLEDETVWLTQKLTCLRQTGRQVAELFQVKPPVCRGSDTGRFRTGRQNITMHLKNIYEEGELDEKATCKNYLQVQKGVTA